MPFQLPKTKYAILPYLAMFVAATIWAFSSPIVKVSLQDVSVMTFLFFRFLIVGVIMIPYLFIELKKNPIDRRDIPEIILLGIISQVSILLIFIALKLTTAIDTALITLIAPILTYTAGSYFYKERITKPEMVGIALATIGTLAIVLEPLIAGQNIFDGGGKRLLGNLFALLYQFAGPAHIILGKVLEGESSVRTRKVFTFLHMSRLHEKYSPGILTSLSFFVALAVFIPLAILESRTSSFSLDFTQTSTFGLWYMVILSSIVAYSLFQWAFKYMEVQETAPFTYLSIIFTVPAAFLILGEVPTQTMVISSAVIAIGVIIAEKFKS